MMLLVGREPAHGFGVHHDHPVVLSVTAEAFCADAVIRVAVFVVQLFDCEALADVFWVSHLSVGPDRKSTRLNSSHVSESRMPSSA